MAGPGRDDHDEEVRFAVVLNGGVSLAIWMGGVTYEIDRLTRTRPGADSVYGRVLDLVQARARADVIAGTSAGGINGAFLALGQAYEYAELSGMRDLWASKGSFAALLRSPVRGPLPSLLRGDDYFLPELRKAFEGVVHTPGRNMTDRRERPVDLFLTTTIPEGQRRRFSDVLEQPIWEVEHTNRFTFSRTPAALRRPGTTDEFAGGDIHRQLALAARSTASFPGAFEPSFIPVGRTEADDLHPDMAGRVDLNKDRYGIDGGVLLNKPLGLALQAIWKKRASTQVRRMLLYVNPDPGREPADNAQPRAPIPPLRDVLIASLTRLTLGQTIHEDLEELREANRRARDARRARPELLQALGTPDQVRTVARDSFAIYQDVRAVRAARNVANLIAEQDTSGHDDRVAGQGSEQLRDLISIALRRTHPGALPYVPTEEDLQPSTALARWSWGIAPLERLAAFARDLFKRAIWLLPAQHSLVAELKDARAALNAQRDKIDGLRSADTEFWGRQAKQLLDTTSMDLDEGRVNEWVDQALTDYNQWLDEPTVAGTRRREHAAIAQGLAMQLPVVAKVAALPDQKLAPVSQWEQEIKLLRQAVTALGIQADGDQANQRLLGNLLAFEVCQLPVSGDSTDNELTADLVLISAHTPNRFATTSSTAQDKVTGLQLHHFGAFYKESWRVNDWIWGRLDAVTRLLEALLDADRLRQRGITPGQIRRRLAGLDDEVTDQSVNQALELQLPPDLVAEVNEELELYRREGADQDGKRSLGRLYATAQAFAHQLHQQIVAEELDRLAVAVRNDQSDGASRTTNGSRFLNHYNSLTAEQRKERALELFDQARIGAEPIAEEFGTDLFARTASTATAGIVGTVDDQSSGLGRLRAITRPIRGLTLVLYALLLSMTRGGFGAALVNLALAAGGALVAVSLFTNEPGWVTSLGAVLVLAGLFAAALRSRLWNLGLVVGPPLLFVVIFLLVQPRVAGNLGVILAIVAIVVAASLLGMVREPARLPDRGYFAGAAKTVAWLVAAAIAIFVLYWLFDWVRTPRSGDDWRQVVTFLLAPDQTTSRHARDALVAGWDYRAIWLAIIAAVGALVVVAVAVSWAVGRLAKRRRDLATDVIMPHQEVSARWMPWYGLAFGLIATAAYGVALFGKVAAWQPALALTALACWALTTFLAPWLLLRAPRRTNEVPPTPVEHPRRTDEVPPRPVEQEGGDEGARNGGGVGISNDARMERDRAWRREPGAGGWLGRRLRRIKLWKRRRRGSSKPTAARDIQVSAPVESEGRLARAVNKSESTQAMRDATKWMLGAFAGVGAVLVAGLQLRSVGRLDLRDGYVLAALGLVLLALVLIARVIYLASRVLTTEFTTLNEAVARSERWNLDWIEQVPRVHTMQVDSLRNLAEQREQLHKELRDQTKQDESRQRRLEDLDQLADDAITVGNHLWTRERYHKLQRWAVGVALVVVVAILAFARVSTSRGAVASNLEVMAIMLSPQGRSAYSDLLGEKCVELPIPAAVAPSADTLGERLRRATTQGSRLLEPRDVIVRPPARCRGQRQALKLGAGEGSAVTVEPKPSLASILKPTDALQFRLLRPWKEGSVPRAGEIEFGYGFRGDRPLVGDWDGDGIDTVGVHRGRAFYLRDSNTPGGADVAFTYGRSDDTPLVGDWDGDGKDTVGVRRGRRFLLRNSNTPGRADLIIKFEKVGDTPLVGDWDGDGTDTVGVHRGNTFLVSNRNASGQPDLIVKFEKVGDTAVVGDWGGDGKDTVGVRRGNNFYLTTLPLDSKRFKPEANIGPVPYGEAGDRPLVGDWDDDGADEIGLQQGIRYCLPAEEACGMRDWSWDDDDQSAGAQLRSVCAYERPSNRSHEQPAVSRNQRCKI